MAKLNLLLVAIVLLSASIYPTLSISRWFSSSFHDLRFTLRRYVHCYADLAPLKGAKFNETDYLINQVKIFLDQANYDNEQMANITVLLDDICRSDWQDSGYPISRNIDMNMYNGTNGKANRCKAIDEAMDAMFYVLRRAAFNRSEPLDFSIIKWYPQANNTQAYYNLTDLINTSWIQADVSLESVCMVTDPIKEYATTRQSKSVVQERNQQQSSAWRSFMDYLNGLLNGVLGYQRRFYWESTSLLETIQARVSNQLGSIRDGLGKGYAGTRKRLSDLVSSRPSNRTLTAANVTGPFTNSTRLSASTSTSTTTTTTQQPSIV